MSRHATLILVVAAFFALVCSAVANVPGGDIGAIEVQDTTAPDTSITGGPDGDTADSTPTFTFTSTEPGSTFRCSLDGGPFGTCSGPGDSHTTDALPDGGHSLSVRATDAAGNTDPTAAARLFTVTTVGPPVDTTAPQTTITKQPKGKFKGSRAKVAFRSNEAGSTFECKLDRGAFAPCTSPAKLGRLGRGKHTFSVRATDAAGNTDPSPAVAKFGRAKKRRG